MAVLTNARVGLSRLGATRLGYPFAQGVVLPRYSLLNVARLGATRLNYHSPKVFVTVAGVQVATARAVAAEKAVNGSLSITDTLNATANTARLAVKGFTPADGDEVIVTLGSKNNLRREFAGQVLNSVLSFVGTPANSRSDLNLIDYTWGLNTRKVRKRYTFTTVAVIAADLIATYAPGYTVTISADLGAEAIDEITFTEQTLTGCLTQLTKRAGGDWVCDYHRKVKLFYEDTSVTAPTILNAVHPTLTAFAMTRDLSQVLTRVYVEGGGVNAFAALAVGETILPLAGDPGWYESTGGVVVCGPQRVTYTGVSTSAGGGLVGTGAAPSGAPVLALASGAGIETGAHLYAVTFITAAGESIAGPTATITTGVTAAPLTAPTAGTPTIGTGPNPGSHDYAVTFVTSSGETTQGPTVTKATTLTADPASAPVPGTPTVGAGVTSGQHDYAVTFVTAIGETLPSEISAQVTVGPLAAPASAPTAAADTGTLGTGPETGSHDYAVTFVNTAGETTASPLLTKVTDVTPAPSSAPTVGAATAGTGPEVGSHDYAVTFVTSVGETTPGPSVSATVDNLVPTPLIAFPSVVDGFAAGALTTGVDYQYKFTYVTAAGETAASSASVPIQTASTGSILVTVPNSTNPAVTGINIYRTAASLGVPYKKVFFTLNQDPGTTTSLIDTDPDGARGADAPSANTTGTQTPLTNLPIGGTNVTSRKLYRTAVGSGVLKLLTTIANNSATTYTDATTDASLGATVPAASTAVLRINHLSAIPTGPASTTNRKLYRTAIGSAQLKLVDTIAGNVTSTYTDSTLDGSLGADVPTSNTAAVNIVPLTGIPTGDANVTSRKLYRRSGGAGLKLLATISNNTATTYSDSIANGSLGAAVPSSSTAYLQRIALTAIPLGGATVTQRKVYRTAAGGAQLKLLTTLADNTTTVFADTVTDASLGADVPTSNTATANRVALSSIPIGAASVTQRKVYRTVAAGSQLKLLATIADNVTSTYADSTADASLGANVPVSDTSGLTQPQGNVIAGSTSLQIANIGPFPSTGWAVIGNGQQVIRYTGISGNVLTGIPASGAGAIVATIAFNSTVTAAPALTGIPASGAGSILYPILKGDEVNLFVQVDDLAAQTDLAALLTTSTFVHDGIQEDTLQDRRLSATEARARGTAWLALKREVEIGIRYRTHDLNTRAGCVQAVNLGPPFNLVSDFLIQTVTEAAFLPARMPTFDVTAASTRLSFDEFLRMMKKAA